MLAGSNTELAERTTHLERDSGMYGIDISLDKSKILAMNVKAEQPDIYIRGVKLEAVESFRYLGATIMKDGRSVSEIKTRIAIATGTLAKLKIIWRSRSVPTASKLRLMRAVMSTALYGASRGQ